MTSEVTSRFGEAFGPPTNLLADLADQALYSTDWPVDEVGARLAWDTQRQLYGVLRSSLGQREQGPGAPPCGARAPARNPGGGP